MRRSLAILFLFLNGCVTSSPNPAVTPVIPQTTSTVPIQTTATLLPTTTATPEFNLLTTRTSVDCPPGRLDEYLRTVMPLADQHTVDSYQAQKLEALTGEDQIKAMKEKSVGRLVTLKALQPPACAQEVHTKLMKSFELLKQTWEQIAARDYEAAKKTLKDSYLPLGEAVVLIVELQGNLP